MHMMRNTKSEQCTTGQLSDEDYFILKAKKALKNNIGEAKVWLLTAKTLYPQNFKVLFESYLLEKQAKDAKKAAHSFTALFQSFASEYTFWHELHNLTASILSEKPTLEQTFLKNLFSGLPLQVQHDILSLTAERSEDPMEHCRLMLLLLNRFPQTLPKLGVQLAETLMTAEKHSTCCHTILNNYRKILVHDLLPILLERRDVELSTKILIRMLHKMIGFYIMHYMSEIFDKKMGMKTGSEKDLLKSLQGTKNKHWKKYEFTWEKMFHLMQLFGSRLDWELCSVFGYSQDKEAVLQTVKGFINARQSLTERVQKQLVLCLTVLFAYALCQYNIQLYSDDGKSAYILVEAFCSDPGIMQELPLKKQKSFVQDNKPTLTAVGENREIIEYFTFAIQCWQLIHSTEPLPKEFIKLKQNINLDPWLPDFLFDLAMYDGKVNEYPVDFLADARNIRTALRKLSYHFVLGQHNMLTDACINVVKLVESIPEVGAISDTLSRQGGRHLCFLPVQKLPVLQYTIKILMSQFLRSAAAIVDKNRLNCQLLTLSQFNWPSEQQLAKDIFVHIREIGYFGFHGFSNFIVNIEILEEFMSMVMDENNVVKLDIIPPSSKKLNETGAKESREALRKFIRNQVKRCDEPLYAVLTNFILQEEPYLPR